ncbi:MAG: hypothetical protein ACFE9R_16560 [Candidatus Hermodarchaeota archaeon]
MPKRKEIVYENIEDENLLILADNETIRIEILNNGYEDEAEIEEVNEKTKDIELKVVPKYVYEVKDLNDNNAEKEWSTLSKTVPRYFKEHLPLKGKKFSVFKRVYGKGKFDKEFIITPI